MKPNRTIFISIAIYINITNGLNVKVIKAVKEKDIIDVLKDVTDKNGLIYDVLTNYKINEAIRNSENNDKNVNNEKNLLNVNKRVLVKWIIPHGYKVGKYDYDKTFNIIYKPLVRIHKTRVQNDNNDYTKKEFALERDNFKANNKAKGKYRHVFIFKTAKDQEIPEKLNYNNAYLNALSQPLSLKLSDIIDETNDLNKPSVVLDVIKVINADKKKISNDIYINGDNIRKSVHSTHIANKDMYNILEMLGRNRHKLRASMLMTKSAEEEEEYQPPKYAFQVKEEGNSKKPSMQYYPFWNYWTVSIVFIVKIQQTD